MKLVRLFSRVYTYWLDVLYLPLPVLILLFLLQSDLLRARPPYCVGNDHIEGRWVLNTTKPMSKSFICCGWDPGDYLDPLICGPSTAPKAINTTNIQGNNQFFSQGGGHACACDTREGGSPSAVRAREMYYWHPRNCTLPRWSASRFCQLLGKRNILFVGDSTNRQTSTTLMSMITAGRGNCSHQIYSARSDSLVSQANGSKTLTQIIHSHSLPTLRMVPDIVVMSTGAHFRSIDDYQTNWEHVYNQIVFLHQQYPKIKFFWKTQNPGHVLCQNDPQPIALYERRNERRDIYHWNLHRDYDLISYKYVQNLTTLFSRHANQNSELSATAKGFSNLSENDKVIQVLDMFPLYLRPDAHPHFIKDCLHYCQPGPLDIVSILLLNKLITREM